MSYARWFDGDVYVVATRNIHGEDGFECIWCDLHGRAVWASWFVTTEEEMIEHLTEHREKGDSVPQYAIDRLTVEAMERKEGDCRDLHTTLVDGWPLVPQDHWGKGCPFDQEEEKEL